MYIPAPFVVNDRDQLHAFIRSHGFAIMVSVGEAAEAAPIATHLPLSVSETPDAAVRLVGHVAKGNPQWKFANGHKVLAIFSGPHAHISASWYGEKNVVPTWNYVAVHVTGTLQIEHDPHRLMELMKGTVADYESVGENPWRIDSTDIDFRERMANCIIGFSIEIDTIQGCWKLSQHHSESRRSGAIAGLRERASGDDLEVADLMESSAVPPQ